MPTMPIFFYHLSISPGSKASAFCCPKMNCSRVSARSKLLLAGNCFMCFEHALSPTCPIWYGAFASCSILCGHWIAFSNSRRNWLWRGQKTMQPFLAFLGDQYCAHNLSPESLIRLEKSLETCFACPRE